MTQIVLPLSIGCHAHCTLQPDQIRRCRCRVDGAASCSHMLDVMPLGNLGIYSCPHLG